MLRMTEDHVLPELNKVAYIVVFFLILVALVELSLAGRLHSLKQLLVSRILGCRHSIDPS